MTITKKNRDYYHEILITPCYLLRNKLHEDYELIMNFGLNTTYIIAMVAEHLTVYNELADMPIFFRMRHFKSAI